MLNVRTDPPACRQCGQPDVGDPLEVPSKSTDSDSKSSPDADSHEKASASTALSQVLGRVLEQLSVSAWLPAAMLVGNVAVLLQLRANRDYDIARALKDLAGKPLGTIIILVFAIVLATIVTQAFEFEAIRLLEGYFDSPHRAIQAAMASRIRRHEHKRQQLVDKLELANKDACQKAVATMRGYSGYRTDVLDYLANETTAQVSDEVARRASETNWRRHAPSAALYRIDSIAARLGSYPQKHRLLPTRLGNVLRTAEDKVKLKTDENIQGYVIRNYDRLTPALKSEHGSYRTRLDMYCCLVLAFSALAVVSGISLSGINPTWGIAVAVTVYGIMAYVSYEAAIMSARSYGLILQEITQYLDWQDETAEDDVPSTFARLLALLHRNSM